MLLIRQMRLPERVSLDYQCGRGVGSRWLRSRSVGWFARNFTGFNPGLEWFLEQAVQFGAGLPDERRSEFAGRLLALGGEILDSQIQQRNIFFEPAQGSPYAANAVCGREHGGNLQGLL
jgi:hypothetical protein